MTEHSTASDLTSEPALRLDGVRKTYEVGGEEVVALDHASLTLARGEIVALVGPSGSGKTTLCSIAGGLLHASEGSVVVDGQDITTYGSKELSRFRQESVGFVFQAINLVPFLTARENLLVVDEMGRRSGSAGDRADQLLEELGLGDRARNLPGQLSGGQRQRVAIGRALVRKPSIYLMDEPLSSLDAKLRGELRLELKRIQSELGATVLYVTHDQIEAMTMADRIGILAEGVLVQIGTPRTIYTQPANLHVAARLGQPQINLIPAGLLPDADAPAGTRTIGARTEHLAIEKAANGHADGTVDWVEHLGDQNHLHLTVKGRKLITLTDPDTPFRKGDAVEVRYRSPLFFDEAGNRIEG